MSALLLTVTGTLVHHGSFTYPNSTNTQFNYTVRIEPTDEGCHPERSRRTKQLYLSTFSTSINGELKEAMDAKEPVTLLCEVTGQPGAKAGDGLNRIKPVRVWLADELIECLSCYREHHKRDQVLSLYPDKTLACCPHCGAGDILKPE